MDYAALITALPAETITAVSGTPQGLTLASQVKVSEHSASSSLTERAFWQIPPEYIEHSPVVGGYCVSYVFELYMSKSGGTNAELQVWADQIRAHFGGRRRPSSITDLLSAKVGDMTLRSGEHGGDAECILEVTFIGINRPGST